MEYWYPLCVTEQNPCYKSYFLYLKHVIAILCYYFNKNVSIDAIVQELFITDIPNKRGTYGEVDIYLREHLILVALLSSLPEIPFTER